MRLRQLLLAVLLAGCGSRASRAPETDISLTPLNASAEATTTSLAIGKPSSDCPPAPATEWERRRIREGSAVRNASPDDEPSIPPPYVSQAPPGGNAAGGSAPPCR